MPLSPRRLALTTNPTLSGAGEPTTHWSVRQGSTRRARTPAGPPRGGERTVHHDRSEAPQHRHFRLARRRLAKHGRRLPPPRPRCHVAGVRRLAGRRTRRARGRTVWNGDGSRSAAYRGDNQVGGVTKGGEHVHGDE